MRSVGDISKNLDLPAGSRGQGGRKGHDGSEEVPDFKTVKEASRDIMKMLKKQEAAKEAAAKAINALAERSNTNSKNLRRMFRANLKGNVADVRRDVEQLVVLFENVGEIASEANAGET